jgi:hypothetical protein
MVPAGTSATRPQSSAGRQKPPFPSNLRIAVGPRRPAAPRPSAPRPIAHARILPLETIWHWRGAALGSILMPMSVQDQPSNREASGGTIRVGGGPDGLMTYLVDLPPEALPSVCKRDLERAWYAAREAALAERQGAVRGFRFTRPDGSHTDLALADRDARCWVGAVDRTVGIATAPGLSLCLRLLALIDLLARAPWARSLFHLARDGAEFHPALLRAAAVQPLTNEARFDEAGFQVRLSRFINGFQIEAPQPVQRLSGAHS